MSVILLILKILGWILLGILGLLLLSIILILFAPLKYHVKGSYYEKPEVRVKAFWLYRILGIEFSYIDGKSYGYWRIFFKKKHLQDDTKENDMFSDEKKHKKEKTLNTNIQSEILGKEQQNKEEKPEEPIDFSTDDFVDIEKLPKEKSNRKKKKNKRRKGPSIFQQIKAFIHNISEMLHHISEIVHNEAYEKAVKHLLQEVVYLLKHILPKKMLLEVRYSTGSPDTTAILFGMLAMFPVTYQNNWKIQPEFEEEKAFAEGRCDIKGKTRAFYFVKAFIRILVDKNCRKLYNDFISR